MSAAVTVLSPVPTPPVAKAKLRVFGAFRLALYSLLHDAVAAPMALADALASAHLVPSRETQGWTREEGEADPDR